MIEYWKCPEDPTKLGGELGGKSAGGYTPVASRDSSEIEWAYTDKYSKAVHCLFSVEKRGSTMQQYQDDLIDEFSVLAERLGYMVSVGGKHLEGATLRRFDLTLFRPESMSGEDEYGRKIVKWLAFPEVCLKCMGTHISCQLKMSYSVLDEEGDEFHPHMRELLEGLVRFMYRPPVEDERFPSSFVCSDGEYEAKVSLVHVLDDRTAVYGHGSQWVLVRGEIDGFMKVDDPRIRVGVSDDVRLEDIKYIYGLGCQG